MDFEQAKKVLQNTSKKMVAGLLGLKEIIQ